MAPVDVVYPRIDGARSIVESEAEVIEREIDALDRFRGRVGRLEPTAAPPAAVGVPDGGPRASGVEASDIRAAYRETLCSMPHYERDYGQPVVAHAKDELGPELGAVLEGDAVIPPVQLELLLGGVGEAIDRRRQFSRTLGAELDSLRETADRLGDVERRLHAVNEARDRGDEVRADGLEALAEDCEALASERQLALHGRPAPQVSGIGERSLVAYLYGDHDHRFPALLEIADVATRIAAAREGLRA